MARVGQGRATLGVIACAFMLVSGCGISFAPREAATPALTLPDTVTFAEHIAPIVRANCLPCHREGHAGPFPLITYTDVAKRSRMVRDVTTRGYMPPWPADTTYARYLGERRLNAREIALIAKWVRQGLLPGDTSALPEPEMPLAHHGLGEPDLEVWLPDTFHQPGDRRDHFIVAKASYDLPRDTFVRAVAFFPGNRRAVHHMNGALIEYAEGAKTDVFAGAKYIDAEAMRSLDAFSALRLSNDDGSYPAMVPSAVNYLPGMEATVYPEGIGGYYLKRKGTFLMNTLHYGPMPRDTVDRSHVAVWFAAKPPERPLQELQLGTNGLTPVEPPLRLKAGEVRTFHTQYTVPKDISVLTVNPHMHLLGKAFLAYAVTLRNDTVPLVRIKQWNFRWQYAYTFQRMLPLKKGSVIHVFGTFDNTANNPDQPHRPPRDVVGTESRFMRTTDEMFQFFVNYVDFRDGDENVELGKSGE